MRRLKHIMLSILILIVTIAIYNAHVVKAKDSNVLTESNSWTSYFENAKGTVTSNSFNSFTANMSSIGTKEWDAKLSLNNISLKKENAYMYNADITSDTDRKIFVQMLTNSTDQATSMFGEYVIDLKAGEKYHLTRIVIPTEDYDDVTLVYGLGKNGYEPITANSKNKITVENVELKNMKNYDYSSQDYIDLAKSAINGYENYSYSFVNGVVITQSDSNSGLDTLWVATTAGPIDQDENGKFKIYLNGKQESPVISEGAWYHFEYSKLIYEYNELKSIHTDGNGQIIGIVVIKNKNVTNYRNEALNIISSYESSSNHERIKKLISDTKEDLKSATTIKEMQDIVNAFDGKKALENRKIEAIEKLEKYIAKNNSKELENIINNVITAINKQDKIEDIQSTLDQYIQEITLQQEKDKAINELIEYIGKDSSKEVNEIFEKAKQDILQAKTKEEITNIVKQAKQDIAARMEAEKINNPLTRDNIFEYISMLVLGFIGIYFSIKYLFKTRSN